MKIIAIILALALCSCANQAFHYRGKVQVENARQGVRNPFPNAYPVYVP